MKGYKYSTPEEILNRSREIIGIPLKDLDKNNRLLSGKGAIGHMIEESVWI